MPHSLRRLRTRLTRLRGYHRACCPAEVIEDRDIDVVAEALVNRGVKHDNPGFLAVGVLYAFAHDRNLRRSCDPAIRSGH